MIRMNPPPLQQTRKAMMAHVLPFVAWIGIMMIPLHSLPWRYALQTAVTASLLLWMRPWRFYTAPVIRHLPLATVAGAAVFLVWVGPELSWMLRFPYLHDLYLRYAVRPLGIISGTEAIHPCSPESCGWALALVRLAGSALVIAPAEEFFWRGFLYRWMVDRDFLSVPERPVHVWIFLATAVLFGWEHDRWLVGIVAGLAYGGLYARTRCLGAAVMAHVVTNLLLGLHVLATGSYHFW